MGQSSVNRGQRAARTLVIGCGFIGSRIVSELVAAGDPPFVLTRSRPTEAVASLLPAERLLIGDASDPAVLERALEGADVVVFSAGGLLPAASELDPELDAQLTLAPLRAVLAALRERPGASLIYLSSGGTVYGEPDSVPVGEEAETRPLGVYGRLHVECEGEVMREREERGLAARVLRCATVYGEGQIPDRGQGAVVTFLDRVEAGVPIDLFGGGASLRDYIYVGDVAGAVIALRGRHDGPPIVNVGSGLGTSLIDLLRLVEETIGHAAEIVEHPARDFEVHQIVLDISRLQELAPFEPTPLSAGVARTQEWLAGFSSAKTA